MSPEEDEDRSGALTIDEENDGFIQVEEGRTVYMRGSSRLPERGLPVEQRPCIAPYGESGWTTVGDSQGKKHRLVNGILGILLREHYPGMVTLPGEGNVPEPTRTWYHYVAYEDLGVANTSSFTTKRSGSLPNFGISIDARMGTWRRHEQSSTTIVRACAQSDA